MLFEDKLVLTVDGNSIYPNKNTSKRRVSDFVSFFHLNIDLSAPEQYGFSLIILKIAFNKIFTIYSRQNEYILLVSNLTTLHQDTFDLLTSVEEIFPISDTYVMIVYDGDSVYLWNVSTENNIMFDRMGYFYPSILYFEHDIIPPVILNDNKIALLYEDGYCRIYDINTDVRVAIMTIKLNPIDIHEIVSYVACSNSELIIIAKHHLYRVNLNPTLPNDFSIEKGPHYLNTIYEAILYDSNHIILAVQCEEDYKIIVWNISEYSEETILYVSKDILYIAGITSFEHVAIIAMKRYLYVIEPNINYISYCIDILTDTMIAK